jgi:hypothetical protein
MFITSIPCRPAGAFSGPLVVTMRPIPAPLVPRAVQVSGRFPAVHGAPVHVGEASALGIRDLGQPDFGDPVTIRPGEIPVFWACGVTPQAVAMQAKPPSCSRMLPATCSSPISATSPSQPTEGCSLPRRLAQLDQACDGWQCFAGPVDPLLCPRSGGPTRITALFAFRLTWASPDSRAIGRPAQRGGSKLLSAQQLSRTIPETRWPSHFSVSLGR